MGVVPLRTARFVPRAITVLIGVSALALAGCSGPGDGQPSQSAVPPSPAVAAQEPTSHTMVLDADDTAELALTASQVLFQRADVVVLASADATTAMPAMSAAAVELHAPALLAGGSTSDAGLGAELDRLGASTAVVVEAEPHPLDVDPLEPSASPSATDSAAGQAAASAGLDVVRLDPDAVGPDGELDPVDLEELQASVPSTGEPQLLSEVLALTDPQPGQEAAIATVQAAGAVTYEVPGGDLGADADAIQMLDDAQALTVVGVGHTFGDARTFAWKVAAAERGALLPTGNHHLFPGRYVTTSAGPGDVPEQVVARAAADAEEYRLEDVPLVPTVSVTASSASWYQGDDGDWVDEAAIEDLEPLVAAARDEGQYVLLEIGAGTAPLVDEVRTFEPLLSLPGVGVAIHPEKRRGDGVTTTSNQVSADEITAVIEYLADVTTHEGLPPTLLVIHQTRPDSVPARDQLRSSPQVGVVIQADRTGGATTGEWVWNEVSRDVPPTVELGWSGPSAVYGGASALVPADPAPVLVAAS